MMPMSQCRTLLAAAVCCAAVSTAGASAQEPAPTPASGRGPVLLTVPASTRALGMGGAFMIGSTDSDAIFYNAAFPDRLRGAGAAVQWYGSGATLYTMSAGVEWWRGGLALGVRALEHGMPSGHPTRFEPQQPGESTLPQAGVHTSERAASLAYARRIRGIGIGVTGHLVEQRVQDEKNIMPAGDVAVGHVLGVVAAGFAVRNIGVSYDLAGTDVALPLTLSLSAAAVGARPVGPLDVWPAVYVDYEIDGDVVPGGGFELSYWPVPGRTFSLRVGGRRAPAGVRPFTVGAGFTGDRLILDYALVPYDGAASAHRFGVRWR
jgi:hypothetical protein